MSNPSTFRFVIIGSGNMSNTYVAAVDKLPGVEIVGVVSRSQSKPQSWPDDRDLEVAESLQDIRTEFDGVIVTTPNGLHHGPAIEAARLGKHVVTEKPLDVTTENMDAMTTACRKAGVRLGVAFQRRMSPDNIIMKAILDKKEIGRVFAADLTAKFHRPDSYYGNPPYRGTKIADGGGPFMHQASHNIDIYTWFFGMPSKVASMLDTFTHRIEVEDHGACLLRHADGMIGTIVASTATYPGFPPKLEIFTERGSVVMENDVITQWSIQGMKNPSRPQAAKIHDGSSVAVTETAGHEAILEDFVEAVRGNREPAVPADSARMATELVLQIYRSQV